MGFEGVTIHGHVVLMYLVVYLRSTVCLSFWSVFNSAIVLFFWHRPSVRERQTQKNDNNLNMTASLSTPCLRIHRINGANDNSKMFHEALPSTIATDRKSPTTNKNKTDPLRELIILMRKGMGHTEVSAT